MCLVAELRLFPSWSLQVSSQLLCPEQQFTLILSIKGLHEARSQRWQLRPGGACRRKTWQDGKGHWGWATNQKRRHGESSPFPVRSTLHHQAIHSTDSPRSGLWVLWGWPTLPHDLIWGEASRTHSYGIWWNKLSVDIWSFCCPGVTLQLNICWENMSKWPIEKIRRAGFSAENQSKLHL